MSKESIYQIANRLSDVTKEPFQSLESLRNGDTVSVKLLNISLQHFETAMAVLSAATQHEFAEDMAAHDIGRAINRVGPDFVRRAMAEHEAKAGKPKDAPDHA
jgi:hypothetical protein